MARNGSNDPALPWTEEVGDCEMHCCHVNRFLPFAEPVTSCTDKRRKGEREVAGQDCSSVACYTP